MADVHCRFRADLFNDSSISTEQGGQALAQPVNIQALPLWSSRYFSPCGDIISPQNISVDADAGVTRCIAAVTDPATKFRLAAKSEVAAYDLR